MKIIKIYQLNNLPKIEQNDDDYLFVLYSREMGMIKKIMEAIVVSYNNINYHILIHKTYFYDPKDIINLFDFLDFHYQKYYLFHTKKTYSKDEYYLFYDYNINYLLVNKLYNNIKNIRENIKETEINVNFLSNEIFIYNNILDLVLPIINITRKFTDIPLDINKLNILSIGEKGILDNKKINYIKFYINNIVFKIGFNIKNNNKKVRLITNFFKKEEEKSYIPSLFSFPNFRKSKNNNNKNENENENKNEKQDENIINLNDDIFDNINYNDYNSIEQKCICIYNKCKYISNYFDNIFKNDNIITIELLTENLFEYQKFNENIDINIFDNYTTYKDQLHFYIIFNDYINHENNKNDYYFNYDNIC